jgi:cellulose synthase/poly-beta-1,6-N-acetylglucosamine synthase-like glycosyltransferase
MASKHRSGSKHHMAFYWSLYALLGLSISGFILSFKYRHFWEIYKQIYFIVLLAYVWYIFILLFIGELKSRKISKFKYKNESIAVLIPCYNEDEPLLEQCLRSVAGCKGNKTVFLLDDGSIRGMDRKRLKKLCKELNIDAQFFDKNRGKRHVLFDGVKVLGRKYDYVVTIDSDTVLAKDALIKLIAPFQDNNVGATTGNVLLLNEKQNLLTRMVGAYYWIGLEVFKQAQSTYGFVVCCSGCIAAYRGNVIADIIDEFAEQEFRGEPCTHSEDRYLTNLVLRDGHLVKYAPEALSYTRTPHTIKGFLKQQQRWKRGYIRESTFTLTYAWRTRKLLFLESIMCELTIPFLAFGLMADLILVIAKYPQDFVTTILPYWILFMFVRYSPVIFRAPSKIPGLLIYAVFYDLFLYWQNIYALFTTKNKGWLTR